MRTAEDGRPPCRGNRPRTGNPAERCFRPAGLIASGKLSNDEIAESAVAVKTEAEKMTTIIRQLLDFARAALLIKRQSICGT